MDMQLARDRLAGAVQMLEADGYGLDVAERGGVLELTIVASPEACEECLVPEDVMVPMLGAMLDPDGTEQPAFCVVYPEGDAGAH